MYQEYIGAALDLHGLPCLEKKMYSNELYCELKTIKFPFIS